MKKSERFSFDSEPMSDGQFDVLVIDRTIRVSKSNPTRNYIICDFVDRKTRDGIELLVRLANRPKEKP